MEKKNSTWRSQRIHCKLHTWKWSLSRKTNFTAPSPPMKYSISLIISHLICVCLLFTSLLHYSMTSKLLSMNFVMGFVCGISPWSCRVQSFVCNMQKCSLLLFIFQPKFYWNRCSVSHPCQELFFLGSKEIPFWLASIYFRFTMFH